MGIRTVLYVHVGSGSAGKELLKTSDPAEQARLEAVLAHRLSGSLTGLTAPTSEDRRHRQCLRGLLSAPAGSGVLVLMFFDLGWLELLNEVGRDHNLLTLAKAITASERIRDRAAAELNGFNGAKVRIITANDLAPVVNNLRGDRSGDEGLRLRKYMSGERVALQYDSPKVVEALVRIRLLGAGVPVFRIDWDAFANEEAHATLWASVLLAEKHYDAFRQSGEAASFMFSGTYSAPDAPPETWTAEAWMRAFATRAFPALLATPTLLGRAGHCPDQVIDAACDAGVMRAFYGLTPDGTRDDASNTGIHGIGADPTCAPISGALLCLSSGAILDLPPFSNFSDNVMWIDDHLKFELHARMGHVPRGPVNAPRGEQVAVRGTFLVNKHRPPVMNVARYVLGDYLPILLRGTVMDRWVRGANGASSPFGALLEDVTACGHFAPERRREVRQRLLAEARSRVEEVRGRWRQLVSSEGTQSLAALWADGVDDRQRDILLAAYPGLESSWLGWGMVRHGSNELRPELIADIERLVEDALGYVDWVLDWPKYTQAIRAPRQSRLPTDLAWNPPG